MKRKFPKIQKLKFSKTAKLTVSFLFLAAFLTFRFYAFESKNKLSRVNQELSNLQKEKDENIKKLESFEKDLENLKKEDQYKKNVALQEEIANIQKTYKGAVLIYEDLIKLKEKTDKTKQFDELFTKILVDLSSRDFLKAQEKINNLSQNIKGEEAKLAASFTIPQSVPENDLAPETGYSRQRVLTDAETFMVSIVAGDLGTTKVVVDTASDSDCFDNCPTLPLATYVSRNGAFAGVNGSYFCPAEYPSCAGKTNSFDLLVMNKNKTYFNSGNNVYSGNPAVIFGGNYIRFVGTVSEWGRDTGPNGVLSNFPLLLSGENISFGGDEDPKKGSKGARSFVANKGNTIFIGVVHNATVAESARVMKALGMENALNLDNGGSTALWYGGYKVGPGRNLPNAIIFIRK